MGIKKIVNLDFIKKEYLINQKSATSISKELGVSKYLIINILKNMGIPLRKFPTKIERNKISESKKMSRNPMWKGDDVGYFDLYTWIRNNKSKPEYCEICNKKPPKQVANLSGKYKRDINDFEWLCRNCHMKKDGRLDSLINLRKNLRIWKNGLAQCSKCQKFREEICFYKNSGSTQIRSACKACYSKEGRQRYKKSKRGVKNDKNN